LHRLVEFEAATLAFAVLVLRNRVPHDVCNDGLGGNANLKLLAARSDQLDRDLVAVILVHYSSPLRPYYMELGVAVNALLLEGKRIADYFPVRI